MLDWLIYGMVYLGSALMVHNIYGFIKYAMKLKKRSKGEKGGNFLLYFPIALLVMFLIGYLVVGIFGNPDIVMSGILFGGSIFVFVIYIFLERITNRIIEQEEIKANVMAAEESNRVKTGFLASVSHEMRTPMNIIIGLDAIALKDETLKPETRSQLVKLDASAKQLLGLINTILDMNGIESGELKAKDAEFSLSEAVEQVAAVAETLCDGKGLTFEYSSQGDLNGKYISDEVLIKHALNCLLDNAVKFTEAPGKVSFRVENEGTSGDRDTIKFTVTDTGVGIDPEFLPKLFGAFMREDQSSTASRGGSGLGLAITKRMTDLLGGTIEAESEKGKGSAFTLTLPLKRFEEVENKESYDIPLEGRRVLIAEDIPENAEIVADLLELEGALSEHAENGRIAVGMFKNSPVGYYDAVLMDLRMPEMDGFAATEAIRASGREDSKTVPIIALTANAYESDVKHCFESGMNAHLSKPADTDMLYGALKKHIAIYDEAKGGESR